MNEDSIRHGQALRLLEEAGLARRDGHSAGARKASREALDAARSTDDTELLARALNLAAQVERDLGHTGPAIELYTELEDLHGRQGNEAGVARALRHQADIHRASGLIELAESLYGEALRFFRRSEDTSALDLANALRGMALLCSLARRPDRARPLWEEARTLYETSKSKAGVSECDLWLNSTAGHQE